MAKKKTGRMAKAFAEIERLKAKRRLDIIKILGALTVMMLLLLGKPALETVGILEQGNMVTSGALWLSAFVLAVFAGAAGRDFSKCSRSIEDVCTRNGITKADISAHEKR